MIRVAHLTDLHLVERAYVRRGAVEQCRIRYLNAGRNVDPERRRLQAVEALRAARHADCVVITGDLTEEGLPAQFEVVAQVLDEAGVRADRVTLVAGNHDYYTGADAFERALDGPLRPYAARSRPGITVDLGGALLLPISTAVPQSFLRSGGVLRREDAERIAGLATQVGTLLVAQHHPPTRQGNLLRHWVDGLGNAKSAVALLAQHTHLHVLHGHLHLHRSRSVERTRAEQVHCAGAVLESSAHVRFYDVGHGAVRSIDAAALAAAVPRRTDSQRIPAPA